MGLQEPIPGQPLTATWGRDVVREIKRLRPSAGPGMRMSYGPNGTTMTPVARGSTGGTVSLSNGLGILPFRLGVGTETVTSGTTTTTKFHKVAITPAVDIDEIGYTVVNNIVDSDAKLVGLPLPKSGSGLPWVWIKDAALTDITDEAANRTTTDVYLHIDRTNHACVLANTETITATEYEDSDGNTHPFHSDYNIIIGKFDLPEDSEGDYDATKKPQVLGQYQIGTMAWESGRKDDFPFKLKWENEGTEESPDWKALVYLPSGSVQWNGDSSTTGVVCANTKKGTSDWYYVDEETDGSTDTVYLNGYHYYKGSGETIESIGFAFIVTNKKTKAPGTWGEGWEQHSQYLYSIALAKIDSNDNFISSVTSAVALDRNVYDYIGKPHGGGGGGGGTTVTITDNRTDKTKTGLVGFSGTGPSGEIPLIVENSIGSDLVIVDVPEQGDPTTLDDWLLDKAIDKDNFEEVLGPTITPDEEEERATGEPPPAAPSYHTHQITQLADAEGIPLTDSDTGPETVREWLEALGIVTSGGMIGPTGATGEIDPVVSESSINFDDATIIKHDAATPSPGGGGEEGGLLALADHVHPLNLVETDAATGPTGATAPESPDANQYVKPVGSAAEQGPSGPVPAPTKASFGTDTHYARVDHVHPMATDGTGATGIGTDASDIDPFPSTDPVYGSEELREADLQTDNVFQQEWVRDSDTNGKGVKFTICVGYAKIRDLMYSVIREVEFDQYGLLRKVSKAKYAIYHPTMF